MSKDAGRITNKKKKKNLGPCEVLEKEGILATDISSRPLRTDRYIIEILITARYHIKFTHNNANVLLRTAICRR